MFQPAFNSSQQLRRADPDQAGLEGIGE